MSATLVQSKEQMLTLTIKLRFTSKLKVGLCHTQGLLDELGCRV